MLSARKNDMTTHDYSARAVPCACAFARGVPPVDVLPAVFTNPIVPRRSGTIHCLRHSDLDSMLHPAADGVASTTLIQERQNAQMQ
jgi:hypothetical protein